MRATGPMKTAGAEAIRLHVPGVTYVDGPIAGLIFDAMMKERLRTEDEEDESNFRARWGV